MMVAPILTTKLFVPPVRPDGVPRPRLVERLNAGLHRKLTLLSAPAGFGKTMLMAEWLSGLEHPFAWLSLDEGDNDLARFFTYVIAAVQRINAQMGQAAQVLSGSSHLPSPELLMTALIDGMAAVSDPFVLVLDDYHVIQVDPVHQAVTFLLDHQPPQLHLVLVTRTDPPLPLSRLRVRDQVGEIRADDLRFTQQESAAFLQQSSALSLDETMISKLKTRTEGWVAGLQLAALSMRGRSLEQVADFVNAFDGSHRHVIDYLTDEVMVRQPKELERFLRQTAILERLTAPLCDAITGRDDSDQFLRQLEQANLFLIPLDDQRVWFRYHRLFADYLRAEPKLGDPSALHLKAAEWFAEQGLVYEAVHHTLASGNIHKAAEMIALAADATFRTAAFATLSSWLDALPDELVQGHLDLAVYKGFLLFFSDQRAKAASYAKAAGRCLLDAAALSSRGRLRVLQSHVAMYEGDHETVIRLSREALDNLDDQDTFFRSLALNALGQALELQGAVKRAVAVYHDGFLTERRAGNHLGALVVFTNLVFALNELGRRREAEELCRQMIEEADIPTSHGLSVKEGAYLSWSLLSYEANELAQARQQAERALDLCKQAGIIDGILWAMRTLAWVQLADGEFDAVHETCQEAQHYLADPDLYANKMGWFDALTAQVSLQQGDLAAATRWAEAVGMTPADTPHHWDESIYLVYVRLLLAQQRWEEAGVLLSAMEQSAHGGERNSKLILIHLQQALLHQALGQQEQALERVEMALQLAAPENYVRAFLNEGQGIIELLGQVQSSAPEFVAQILDAAGARLDVLGTGSLVEPLSQRELEVLRLMEGGLKYQEMADQLYVSLNTVRFHAKNIYSKLGVHNRRQAVARANELGLLL